MRRRAVRVSTAPAQHPSFGATPQRILTPRPWSDLALYEREVIGLSPGATDREAR